MFTMLRNCSIWVKEAVPIVHEKKSLIADSNWYLVNMCFLETLVVLNYTLILYKSINVKYFEQTLSKQ